MQALITNLNSLRISLNSGLLLENFTPAKMTQYLSLQLAGDNAAKNAATSDQDGEALGKLLDELPSAFGALRPFLTDQKLRYVELVKQLEAGNSPLEQQVAYIVYAFLTAVR